jgi:hypothetical protein
MENNKSTDAKEIALHYIKTFSDTAREPFLILDPELKVIGANESFYKNFQTTRAETEHQLIFDLGNHQWDIPSLRNLLQDILPLKKVFNDFEVSHEFPKIGLRIMLLNARRLDETQQILLAIEDITLQRAVEIKLANYTKDLETGIATKTEELNARIDELSKLNEVMVGRELKMTELKEEIAELKNKRIFKPLNQPVLCIKQKNFPPREVFKFAPRVGLPPNFIPTKLARRPLFFRSVFIIHITLFDRKLIAVNFKRISQYPAGKIYIGTITFPIKERAGLNKMKIFFPIFNVGIH